MASELVKQDDAAILEQVVVGGDISKLTPAQKVQWYRLRCDSAGLDWRTQPFQYLVLQGKHTLYATRTATDQLRKVNGINCRIVDTRETNDVYCVTVEVSDATGRTDTELGAVSIKGLAGDAYANALMKAITKAKRRATLSICGLGMLDETEVETIPGAVTVTADAPVPTSPPVPKANGNGGSKPRWDGPEGTKCPQCSAPSGKPHGTGCPCPSSGDDAFSHSGPSDSKAQSAAAVQAVLDGEFAE